MTDSNNRCCHNINCDKCKNREIEFNRMKNKMEKYQQALDIVESYIVIDSGKNLAEINKDEQAAIKKQDEFANYESTAKYFKKGTTVYGIGCTVVNVGKYFVSFL